MKFVDSLWRSWTSRGDVPKDVIENRLYDCESWKDGSVNIRWTYEAVVGGLGEDGMQTSSYLRAACLLYSLVAILGRSSSLVHQARKATICMDNRHVSRSQTHSWIKACERSYDIRLWMGRIAERASASWLPCGHCCITRIKCESKISFFAFACSGLGEYCTFAWQILIGTEFFILASAWLCILKAARRVDDRF